MQQRTRGHALGRALVALAMAALLLGVAAACGVSFGASEDETEIFKSLSIEGDFRLGGALRMRLDIEQPYPTVVEVRCDLLDADAPGTATPEPDATPTPVTIPFVEPTPVNKIDELFQRHIGANQGGEVLDELTPVPETVELTFEAPAVAGRYRVRCYTPFDQNNAIAATFTIEPVLAR